MHYLKEYPDLEECPKVHVFCLPRENVEEFIYLYKKLLKDERFNIIQADCLEYISFIAYYFNKDGREVGYAIRIFNGIEIWNFLREKKKSDMGNPNKFINLHGYVGALDYDTLDREKAYCNQGIKETKSIYAEGSIHLSEIEQNKRYYLLSRLITKCLKAINIDCSIDIKEEGSQLKISVSNEPI